MSHFRMISKNAKGAALLLKLAAEGHQCDFWVSCPLAKDIYSGIIGQVNDWREGLDKETILLFDSSGSGRLAGKLRESGLRVFGSGKLNDVFTYDREFALRIAKIHELRVPEFQKFNTFEDAAGFLSGSEQSWNFLNCDFYTNDELIKVLEHYRPVNFILAERISNCKEIRIEAWFLDGELVPGTIHSSIENSEALIAWYWPLKKPNKSKRKEPAEATLYRHTLKKLETFLKKNLFSGPLSARCLISQKDGLPYTTGFRSGLQFPKLYALLEGMDVSVNIGEIFEELASGKMPEIRNEVGRQWIGAAGVEVDPYYPNHLILDTEGSEHLWPIDVKLKDEKMQTAGNGGAVLYVTEKNKSVSQLRKGIASRNDKIKIPDKQEIRMDFFYKAEKIIWLLKKWNYF